MIIILCRGFKKNKKNIIIMSMNSDFQTWPLDDYYITQSKYVWFFFNPVSLWLKAKKSL